MPEILDDTERKLLRDFMRPGARGHLRGAVAVAFIALLALFWLRPDEWVLISCAGLSGLLIGMSAEGRHLRRLRLVIAKLALLGAVR
ncbi:hypothetical protein [Derxia gummosa]|uniref:Uncharacterized protein n=1 Tax=Derxia gummosa DSM 723 TaxID=1121388 RepID=A0A8B6X379_9BURK|nr:hypothetical protein [Derxia gummosa]